MSTPPVGLLDKQRTIAGPGFNRWLVPPAALCVHLCIGMARLRRPHQSHPLRAAPTQGGQLGRAGSRAEVHAAGSQWRRRTCAA